MNRSPSLVLALLLAIGIAMGDIVEREIRLTVLLLGPFLVIALCLVVRKTPWRRFLVEFALVLATVHLGFCLLQFDEQALRGVSLPDSERSTYELRVKKWPTGLDEARSLDATLIGLEKDIGVRVYFQRAMETALDSIKPGDLLSCTGRLQEIRGSRNPGQADFKDIFRRLGILAFLNDASCTPLKPSPSFLAQRVSVLRNRSKTILRRSDLTSDQKSLSLSLLLGDRSEMSDELLHSFQFSGLMHLLAISGLHVGFLAISLFVLLKGLLHRLRLPFKHLLYLRVMVLITLLLFYALLTGMSDSVVRAICMCISFLICKLLGRRFNPLDGLGIAALILLVVNPQNLFQVGFQLSFSAVLGIIVCCQNIRGESGVVSSTRVSFVASIWTAPILLHHFKMASLSSVISSVVATPFCFLTLASSWFMSLLPLKLSWSLFEGSTAVFAELFNKLAEISSKGFVLTANSEIIYWAILIVALLSVYYLSDPKVKWKLFICCLSLFVLLRWYPSKNSDFHDIIFLDVGHGDASLIRTRDNKTILIDAGNSNQFVDIGKEVLLPVLAELEIQKIDALIISHRHLDHFGGSLSLLDKIEIAQVFSNDDGSESTESWSRFRSKLEFLKIPHTDLGDHELVQIGEIDIRPFELRGSYDFENENNKSLMFTLQLDELSLLFLGDAEVEAEWQLLEESSGLKPDIVKVAHHGSRTSSSPELVQHLRTSEKSSQLAVVSASCRFRPASTEVLKRWEKSDFQILSTCKEGAIWLETDGLKLFPISPPSLIIN